MNAENLIETSHDTLVIAWDKTGAVVFCKTYDYDKHGEECQAAYTECRKFNMYLMGSVEHILHTKNFKEDYL